MIIINYTNIENQPYKNMVEVLNTLSFDNVPEFTISTTIPVVHVSTSTRIIKKGLGRNKSGTMYMITFNMGIVDETMTGLNAKSQELRDALDLNEEILSRYNMEFFDIQSSASQLVRNDITYNVRNITVQYIVK